MLLLISFHSAYKVGHSCETALLRVYNDIVTTIGRGNSAILDLIELSEVFDTIDHDNLLFIREKYVGVCGHIFSDHLQRDCCVSETMRWMISKH